MCHDNLSLMNACVRGVWCWRVCASLDRARVGVSATSWCLCCVLCVQGACWCMLRVRGVCVCVWECVRVLKARVQGAWCGGVCGLYVEVENVSLGGRGHTEHDTSFPPPPPHPQLDSQLFRYQGTQLRAKKDTQRQSICIAPASSEARARRRRDTLGMRQSSTMEHLKHRCYFDELL